MHNTELIYREDCPYIELQPLVEGFFMSKAVIRLIGNPNTIRFQWNADKVVLIVEPTDANDANGLLVSELTDTQHSVLFVGSFILFNEIWNRKWSEDNCYRVVAKYNVPSNLAIFDIGKAIAYNSYIDYGFD